MPADLWPFYRRMFRPEPGDFDEREKRTVSEEMRQVIEAPNIKAAAEVIRWWGSFGMMTRPAWNRTAETCAGEIRRRAKRQGYGRAR